MKRSKKSKVVEDSIGRRVRKALAVLGLSLALLLVLPLAYFALQFVGVFASSFEGTVVAVEASDETQVLTIRANDGRLLRVWTENGTRYYWRTRKPGYSTIRGKDLRVGHEVFITYGAAGAEPHWLRSVVVLN